jgi:hypothetical protein
MRGSRPVDDYLHSAIDRGPEVNVGIILGHLYPLFDPLNRVHPCIIQAWGDQGNDAVAEQLYTLNPDQEFWGIGRLKRD